VVDLYHIYSTLESELEIHAPRVFPSIYFPKELNRTESLLDDVEFFHGNKSPIPPPTRAAQEYQARLQWIARKEPLLLLSHAYTRYLGDLSGGRILARVARRAMNLSRETADGLRFYEFDHIASTKLFKEYYRTSLDDMQFSSEEVERLVAEANVAFVLNMRIFEEFDVLAGIPGARVRPLEEALIYYEECILRQEKSGNGQDSSEMKQGEGEEGQTKCPFAFMGGPNPHALLGAHETDSQDKKNMPGNKEKKGESSMGRCPWPFIFFHDPATGFRDYQTWIVFALVFCWLYKSWLVDGPEL